MADLPINAVRSDGAADTRVRARRCGAMTRSGSPCKSYGLSNGRCRMHGGTNPGAPKGNRNAWKHGLKSAESLRMRALLRAMQRDLQRL